MKKILAMLLAALMVFALVSCNVNDGNKEEGNGDGDLRIALNLTEEWKSLGDGELVQGCIIVSNKFKTEHPEAFAKFMEEYKASAAFVVENPKEASVLIEKHGIVAKAALAEKAIPNCNICCIDGETGVSYMKNVLEILYNANPKSVGGKLPTDEFYDSNVEAGEGSDDVTVRVMALKGPTGMGMVQLMENSANGTSENKYDIKLATEPPEVSAAVIAGTVDIAAVPVNLAAVLFSKPDVDISFAAVNTLGVLYVLENGNTITKIEDLKGKKIYATGQGATPQYILEHLLKANGIDPAKDVEIEYIADHAELATKLAANDVAIGVLPEPQVTVALTTAKTQRSQNDK